MTKIKNYLISIVAISLFLLLAVASSDSSDSTPTYSPQSNVDQWYVGGTLHSSSIAEWKNATEKNKLATCADIVANVKKFNNENYNGDLVAMKRDATEMMNCINETVSGDEAKNMKVNEVASLCAILLFPIKK